MTDYQGKKRGKKRRVLIIDGKKECVKCHRLLPLSQYYRNKNIPSQNYLAYRCKDCISATNHENVQKRLEERRNPPPAKRYNVVSVNDCSLPDLRRLQALIVTPCKNRNDFKVLLTPILKELKYYTKYYTNTARAKAKTNPAHVIWFEFYESINHLNEEKMSAHMMWWNDEIRKDLIPPFISFKDYIKPDIVADWRKR